MTNDDDDLQAETTDDERDAVDLQEMGDRALQLVQRQATHHPLRTVGIAMGIGYVLGGGLPRIVVRLGMIAAGRALSRAATIEGVRLLANVARGGNDREAAVDTDETPATEPAAPRTSTRRNGHGRKRGAAARHA